MSAVQLTSFSPSALPDAAYADAARAIDVASVRFPDLPRPQVADVALSLAFLTPCAHTTWAGYRSDRLRHDIEQWVALHAVYADISQGAVLAAAVALGFAVKRKAGNVTQVGVSAPSVRRMFLRPLVVAGREVQ